jgi:hypothetical protein
MSEIDEEHIRKWGLDFTDLISTKLKSNITFKNFKGEEVLYSEFILKNDQPKWVTLCEERKNQQTLIITIDFKSIIACTNNFFSELINIQGDIPNKLTFSEDFIADEITTEIVNAFGANQLEVELIRNEKGLDLVHPFHEDESITVYTYDWTIDNENYGVINLCHSHVL